MSIHPTPKTTGSRSRKLGLMLCCALLCGVPALYPSSVAAPYTSIPTAKNGVLDLRNWDLTKDGPVRLDGNWEFYWDQSFRTHNHTSKKNTPSPELLKVPGSWKEKHPTRGKALYHLQILTPTSPQVYGIKMYEFPQSYRLYINKTQLVENGKYSETPELNSRSLVRPFVVFADSSGILDLYIEATNLDENEPGPKRSIIFGLEKDVRQIQNNLLISDMLVCGILLIMAAYHLGLYLQRHRETGSLLFGLLCLIMIFRVSVTEEHYLHKYFPNFPGTLEGILDVFSFLILAPTFAYIFKYFFDREFDTRVLKIITGIFLICSLLYFFTTSPFVVQFYLIFTLVVSIYMLVVLLLSVFRKRIGSNIFLFGFLIFAATSVWDILSYSHIVQSIYVSQIGFVCFIFTQAYILSMRFNKALYLSEELTLNLEGLVAERTRALEESNQKLALLNITDALTGVFNRRHFDDVLQLEWDWALTNQQPLALLMLDIDHFKAYNDYYGHQEGDTCLQWVASIIRANIRPNGDTLARYGGEEFSVICRACTNTEALATAERIRQAIEKVAFSHAKSSKGYLSVSIGLKSIVPSRADLAQHLVKTSDDALYHAKNMGRNQVFLAG